MCKITILTGIENSSAALEFMKAVEPEMSSGNTDGIGYSAINSKNELFMEKWHYNKKFLRTDNIITDEVVEQLTPHFQAISKYFNPPVLSKDYMSYGNITRDDLKTVTMHTRFATCGKSMENTHPFIYNETSLIHNGIINNDTQLNNKKISTCDSESALQLYLSKNTAAGNKSVYQSFLDDLRGYWAFGILAKSQDGIYMLDVIKGGAQLYFATIPELGENCTVFATNENIIRSACKTLKFDTPKISNLVDNSLTKYNALTGVIVDSMDFSAKKTGYYNSYYDQKETKTYNKFLENKNEEIEVVETLVTYNGKLAQIEGGILQEEMELFDVMDEQLIIVLEEYDMYQGSNYSVFFDKLPDSIQTLLSKAKYNKTLLFGDILRVIEEYNNTTSLAKTQTLLAKLSKVS